MVKLTIGLSTLAVAGFYYLAAAPPASANTTLCNQPGNYSDACPLPSANTTSSFTTVYSSDAQKPTSIPEPGTVTALLLTGVGMICSVRKRKQISEER
ncbi:MAG: PEP-CTERM sorting domain-containing protein [Actinomycetota bacterium]